MNDPRQEQWTYQCGTVTLMVEVLVEIDKSDQLTNESQCIEHAKDIVADKLRPLEYTVTEEGFEDS